MAQKIASTINFPATNSFLETGIIIAYRVHLELSSKEKVVTIIMLHKIGTADEKLDLCKEENRCTLMKNGLER